MSSGKLRLSIVLLLTVLVIAVNIVLVVNGMGGEFYQRLASVH